MKYVLRGAHWTDPNKNKSKFNLLGVTECCETNNALRVSILYPTGDQVKMSISRIVLFNYKAKIHTHRDNIYIQRSF